MGSKSNTSGEVGSRVPVTLSSVRAESKYSLVAAGQRDKRIELAKTTVGSSVSEETSISHAHDDATHAMTMTRIRLRAVERCGRVPYDYSKNSRDSVTMAPRIRTEKSSLTYQLLHAI